MEVEVVSYFEGPGAASGPGLCNENRSHRIEIEIEKEGEGVLFTMGGEASAYVFFVKNRKINCTCNTAAKANETIESSAPLPKGASTIAFEFGYSRDGRGQSGYAVLFLNGKEVGRKRIEMLATGPFQIAELGLWSGTDTFGPIEVESPHSFTGAIKKVDIMLGN
jgi:hypothetical protein